MGGDRPRGRFGHRPHRARLRTQDYELSKELGLDVIAPLDAQGDYVDGFAWLEGRNAALVADDVTAHLRAAGRVVHDELYAHSVPVCWRCKSHVLFRLVYEWFISVDDVREPMLAAAQTVEWEPPHIGSRMDDWLHNMGDWCISRKRYWGLPLPFYRCDDCQELTVVGSRAGICASARSTRRWSTTCRSSTGRGSTTSRSRARPAVQPATRVPEVGDCWLDAGITPFSTLGYFDDPDGWKQRFPAEWISEMREQVRLWYYSMLFMSVVLEGRAPYERALSYERVISETGEKFSKTGHMIRFDDAVQEIGADPIRYLFCRQPPATECRFGFEAGAQSQRRIAGLWNIASFFLTYAGIDRVEMVEPSTLGDALHVTDRWLLARTAQLVEVATAAMGREDTSTTVREAEQFIEEVSNWYVRVNRRRFWRTGDDADKRACHSSLFAALRAVTLVLAPIVPFVTEELWQQVIRPFADDAAESVHHALWPVAPAAWHDDALLDSDAHGPHRHQQFAAPARGSQAPCAPAASGAHDRGRRSRAGRPAATAGDDPRRAEREARRVRGRPLRARGRPSLARLQARRARAAHPARRGIGRDRRAERRRPRQPRSSRSRRDDPSASRAGPTTCRRRSSCSSAGPRHEVRTADTTGASSSRSTPGSTTR